MKTQVLIIKIATLSMGKTLIVSGAIGLFYYFFFMEGGGKFEARLIRVQSELSAEQTKAQQLAQLRNEESALVAEVEKADGYLQKLKEKVPKEIKADTLLREIYGVGESSNVRTRKVQPGKGEIREGYYGIPTNLLITGEFDRVIYFLDQIARSNPVKRLVDFQISPEAQSRDGSTVQLRGRIIAFQQMPEENVE